MEAVAAAMPTDLHLDVLIQGTLSRKDMLEQHKARVQQGQRSIMFGLAGLGEGLDLPGDLLEHLVIAKIPFAPPDSPLEEAMAEWIEQNNGNAFAQMTLPRAGLALIQWAGRPIRTETDTGRITILDRRVTTKRYGAQLLDGLPDFRRVPSETRASSIPR